MPVTVHPADEAQVPLYAEHEALAARVLTLEGHTHDTTHNHDYAPKDHTHPGSASTVLDVRQFGAKCDGSDDTAALRAAVAEAEASGGPSPLVMLGPRHGLSDEVRNTRGIAVSGGSSRATLIHPVGTYVGWLWTIHGADRNGQWQAGDDAYTPTYDKSGSELRNVHFSALSRARASAGLLRVLRADDLLLDNVTAGFTSGTGLQIGAGPGDGIAGGSVRESELNRVKVYKCGGPDVPAWVIQSSPTGSTDGTNQVYGKQFRSVYNHGGGVIRDNGNTEQKVRRVQLDQVQIHGLTHSSVGNVVDHDLVTLEGGLIEVALTGVLANGSGAGKSVFRCKSSAGGRPVGVKVQARASGCAGDVFVADDVAALELDLYAAGGLTGDWVRLTKASAYELRLTGSSGYSPTKVKHPGTGHVSWFGGTTS